MQDFDPVILFLFFYDYESRPTGGAKWWSRALSMYMLHIQEIRRSGNLECWVRRSGVRLRLRLGRVREDGWLVGWLVSWSVAGTQRVRVK